MTRANKNRVVLARIRRYVTAIGEGAILNGRQLHEYVNEEIEASKAYVQRGLRGVADVEVVSMKLSEYLIRRIYA